MQQVLFAPNSMAAMLISKRTIVTIVLCAVAWFLFGKIASMWSSLYMQKQNTVRNVDVDDAEDFTKQLLVAFFSVAKEQERRSLIRSVIAGRYDANEVDVVFAIGQPKSDEERSILAFESEVYDDLFSVSMEENMDSGKTIRFFKDVYERQERQESPRYQYVMKVDTDSFLHMEHLMKALKIAPKDRMYMGRLQFGHDELYMVGMGYILSADLIQEIHNSKFCRHNSVGFEDVVLGACLRHVAKSKGLQLNFVHDPQAFADHPRSDRWWGVYRQEYFSGAIVVHGCKDQAIFLRAVRHYYADPQNIKVRK